MLYGFCCDSSFANAAMCATCITLASFPGQERVWYTLLVHVLGLHGITLIWWPRGTLAFSVRPWLFPVIHASCFSFAVIWDLHFTFVFCLSSFSFLLVNYSLFIVRHSSLVLRHSSIVVRHSSFMVCHSTFVICQLSLVICQSSFVVYCLSFVVRRSSFVVHLSSFVVFICCSLLVIRRSLFVIRLSSFISSFPVCGSPFRSTKPRLKYCACMRALKLRITLGTAKTSYKFSS